MRLPTPPARLPRAIGAALLAALLPVSALVALPATSSSAATTVTGIDVASWQHPNNAGIDWSRVRGAGHSFAIIKATESTTYLNPWFAADRAGAQSAGLVVGAYHYARPALPLSTATKQAKYFAKVIGNQQLSRTLPPILDIESTGGLSNKNLASWVDRFLVTLRQETGRTPMIYSYESFLLREIDRVERFAGYPLWLAKYTKTRPTALPGGWRAWKVWQHTSTGKVPGIKGDVDLNHFNGSRSELLSFASGTVGASVRQAKVQSHEPATISGRVDPEFAGETILRQKKTKKGWQTVSTKTLGATGAFSFTVKPSARGTHQFRVRLHANSPYARLKSKPLSVKVVKPWIKTGFSDSSIKKKHTTHLRGRVDTFYAGERVVRQKLTNGRWKTMSTKRVASNGRYDFTVKPTVRADYRYRVVLKAKTPKATATSRTVTLRVR